MGTKLNVGKLDNETLKRVVLDKIRCKNDWVLVKAGVGEDCAHLDFGQEVCVLSTDPITASVEDIGRLAIHISCNDVAATGVRPFAITLVLLLPPGSELEDIEKIMADAATEAAQVGVEIAGGHTEVTPAVNQPVIIATALGKASKEAVLAREGILPRDRILLTKSAGLEGTAIIAADFGHKMQDLLSQEEWQEARSYADLTDVTAEGVLAGTIGVSAMHDVTEGGVLGAVWELCQVAKVGATIVEEAIPLTPVTKKICAFWNVDPLRLISSGAMLIAVRQEKAPLLMETLAQAGIQVTDIGGFQEQDQGIQLSSQGVYQVIAPPESDELYKVVGR